MLAPGNPGRQKPRCALVVYARAPEAGAVKTRLTPPLTPLQALALHEAMVADTLERAHRACEGLADVILSWSAGPLPGAAGPLEGIGPFRIETQVAGDLGARLADTLARREAEGIDRTVVIGSDAPHMPEDRIPRAFDALDGVDVVLGPAHDGGYYLLGARAGRRAQGVLTEIPWGTSRVLEVSRERARAARLQLREIEPWYDVDTLDDLRRMRRELAERRARGEAGLPERTWRVLEAIPVG